MTEPSTFNSQVDERTVLDDEQGIDSEHVSTDDMVNLCSFLSSGPIRKLTPEEESARAADQKNEESERIAQEQKNEIERKQLTSSILSRSIRFITSPSSPPINNVFEVDSYSLSKPRRISVLFLCSNNSCLSQIAEGWCNKYHSSFIEAHSAGIQSKYIDPIAVRVMEEKQVEINNNHIDLSSHRSKILSGEKPFSFVIILNDQIVVPSQFNQAQVINQNFNDPTFNIQDSAESSDDLQLSKYRRVRDEIEQFVADLPQLFSLL